MDLVRNTADAQAASKILVDHALARFSTDNLSCMIVRFDNKALQQTVDRKTEPIGVEGDPPSNRKGGISEADAIVREARKSLSDSSTLVPDETSSEEKSLSQDVIREEEDKEVGPEIDPGGLKAVTEGVEDKQTS